MYKPYFISLDAVKGETKLIDPGMRIGEIAIIAMPDGGEVWLKIGNNLDYLQVTKPCTFAPDNDNDANNGLWYQVKNALPGQQVQILVSWGGALKTLLI